MSKIILLDGAMGSELIQRGEQLPPHIWSAKSNLTNPKLVYEIHKDYINAGAQYIIANTFRTTPRAFFKTGENIKNATSLAYKAMNIALNSAFKAINNQTRILASIAPLEDCYIPSKFPGKKIAEQEFSLIINWLKSKPIDGIILETMNNLMEVEICLQLLSKLNIPIWLSYHLLDEYHICSGEPILSAIDLAKKYPVDYLLFNCNPLNIINNVLKYISDNWDQKWGVYPNLGIGAPMADGNIQNIYTNDEFLHTIKLAISHGASIIGGCCGSNPSHIALLNNYLSKINS